MNRSTGRTLPRRKTAASPSLRNPDNAHYIKLLPILIGSNFNHGTAIEDLCCIMAPEKNPGVWAGLVKFIMKASG
jgi:hypothetical protein